MSIMSLSSYSVFRRSPQASYGLIDRLTCICAVMRDSRLKLCRRIVTVIAVE